MCMTLSNLFKCPLNVWIELNCICIWESYVKRWLAVSIHTKWKENGAGRENENENEYGMNTHIELTSFEITCNKPWNIA